MRGWSWREWYQRHLIKRRSRKSIPRAAEQVETLELRALPAINLVADLNAITSSSAPQNFLPIGSTTYFTADDGVHGVELWKTDGTPAGTQLVKDINPGNGLYLGSYPSQLTNLGGMLYFTADDGNGNLELWRSDGTSAGTERFVDLNANAGSLPWGLTVFNSELYFTADDGEHGRELWRTNGTLVGTQMVSDINPNGNGLRFETTPAVVGNTLLFPADNGTSGAELWKSDGTGGGTSLVKDINGSGDGIDLFFTGRTAVFNGVLYFAANDGTNGTELWQSNGTTGGTTLVQNIGTAGASGAPEQLTVAGNNLFFTATTSTSGRELWKVATGVGGASLVRDIQSGANDSGIVELTAVGSTVYFSAKDSNTNGHELWKSDGTTNGTQLVTNIAAGSNDSRPLGLTKYGNQIYFMADNSSQGRELWRSDGTAGGTALVKDINSGSGSSGDMLYGMHAIEVSGNLYFSANNGTSGIELWKTNGTSVGTLLLKDINAVTADATPEFLTPINIAGLEGVLFAADDGTTGAELWFSNGAESQTVRVRDLRTGADGSSPRDFLVWDGYVYFTAITGSFGRELWRTNGTANGTELVSDIEPGPGSSDPSELTIFDDALYFVATTQANGRELWKTNGTSVGTTLVADIVENGASSNPGELTVFGDVLAFRANTDELWQTDGTFGGTTLILDVSEANSVALQQLTVVNDKLFFLADDGTHGLELWVSIGTEAGTVLVKDIYPDVVSSNGAELMSLGNQLLFRADDGESGEELWLSDGTEAGTGMLLDLLSGASSSSPRNLVQFDGQVYFSANDGSHGYELWRTDGTQGGTTLVRDINPGVDGSYPQNFSVAQGKLYFAASTVTTGFEPWQTTGTEVSTIQVIDLNPGPASSLPANFVAVGNHLFLTANDGAHGTELFSDINNHPPMLSGQTFNVAFEADPATVVGTIAASDPDQGQTLTFEILSGNTGNAFAVHPTTGQITVVNSAPLDPDVNPLFNLVIRVSDNGDPNFSTTATMTIVVGPDNQAPVIEDQSFFLAENVALNTFVGMVIASDPDVGQTLQYAITDGNQTAFTINPATGQLAVANPAELDFEDQPIITLQVTVTDSNNPSASATATITVQLTNVDEPPSVSLPGGDVTYTRRAAPITLDPFADLIDPDSILNVNGAVLTVRLTQGADKKDKLQLASGGGLVRKGKKVLLNGVQIGTFSGGTKNQPLVVTFNASATLAAVQQTMRQITFSNTTKKTPPGTRTVEFKVVIGGKGLPATKMITLV